MSEQEQSPDPAEVGISSNPGFSTFLTPTGEEMSGLVAAIGAPDVILARGGWGPYGALMVLPLLEGAGGEDTGEMVAANSPDGQCLSKSIDVTKPGMVLIFADAGAIEKLIEILRLIAADLAERHRSAN